MQPQAIDADESHGTEPHGPDARSALLDTDSAAQDSLTSSASSAASAANEPDEVLRLERLLARAGRDRQVLARELDRRSGLLREALARFAELGAAGLPIAAAQAAGAGAGADPSVELRAELDDARAARDAAVARVLDAEAARADTQFRLDEALGHLGAERGAEQGVSAHDAFAQAELQGTLRGLRARLAEAEEALSVSEARLLLTEQDLADALARGKALEREAVDAQERFELEQLRLRTERDTLEAQARATLATFGALQGECTGRRARAEEAEQAFQHADARRKHAEHSRQDALGKLSVARTESAEGTLAAQSRAARVTELTTELAAERESARELRAELTRKDTVYDSLQAALCSRDESVDSLTAKLRVLENALADAQTSVAVASAAGSLGDRRVTGLRRALADVRAPLLELSSALQGILLGSHQGEGVGEAPEMTEESTIPGLPIALDAAAGSEELLRAAQARIEELQAQLAGRMSSRDSGVSALKGELIDVRASAARMADDLAKERSRRRKFAVTVRAMQAAAESGESPVPWVEELIALLNDGASLPPSRG